MNKSINRRNWIKSSLLGLGALTVSPAIAFSRKDSGLHAYLPESTLKEYIPTYNYDESRIMARLSANENPYGPSPKVIQAITESISSGNRYGHQDASTLISMIAEKEGVSKDHIMLGPGSSDLLEKTAFVSFSNGGNIVSADPAYMSIISTARSLGATWKPVPLTKDYAHDLDQMAKAVDSETKLVYVCNPNNPTGSVTDPVKLKAFCASVSKSIPVFVDEAYLEFLDQPDSNTMVGLVAEGKDVIVARTFSKIHGMAGLRIGYIVAQPERIKSITSKVRSTMGLCVTSLKGAIVSMQDQEFLEDCRKKNAECRDFVNTEISALGYDVIPSQTSFLIFPIAMEGQEFMKSMYDSGVGIRVFEINDKPWCRVSMGTREEMEYFVDSFKKVTV
ncbi:aminotransferase class I/II-fold pyridoxal phosphate-dependent enzyme [Belliella sp. DSM 107340]|uniref:Aminotransferase class I/II-fold pyridoxal phosphate-dependent enzyme n=1 Tax=Belliella calami TaxID=2923436 RepID=A0ABS9UL98_9BACT|nr:aminotransferase class I/II-fold pyridoxal phosphate-dependent enzyme [Belliella calami]MCH7397149.1 aminotransferase class I/II-fold pyridoxal phosphate-dependent enzyme [Belliella calami]